MRTALGMVLLLAASVAMAVEHVAPVSPVLPLSAKVEGQGYEELSAAWWQWVMAQPLEPYLDPDGRWCGMGQEGPVWFLAGTDGSFDAKRKCIVPEGKHLFLPVINMYWRSSLQAKRGAKFP